MEWNNNLDEAPKDGTELIFWVSSDKGFEDQTANFFYVDFEKHFKGKRNMFEFAYPDGDGWYWSHSGDKLKRPDLVKGWMIYPQPEEE